MIQKSLFSGTFMEILDANDPLIVLADNYPLSKLEDYLQQFYSGRGRRPKPICLMVGSLLPKQLENLSDEDLILQYKQNLYFQYFCGSTDYERKEPCHSTELVKFRNHIGKDRFEYIFKLMQYLKAIK